MRIMFMGTPEFAVPSLRAAAERHEVCAVLTQPDKPAGRSFTLTPPPVKRAALEMGLRVYQPERIRAGAIDALLHECAPELIVVVAYGKLLPPDVLAFPRCGCVNVHASLLPKYRGAAPINWAIINGERVTGITTMYMAEGLDTGDMILSRAIDIDEYETAGELHDRLMELGARLLADTLDALERGDAPRTPQDNALASYAPMLSKDTGRIDWTMPASRVRNLVRGLYPWPVAHTALCGQTLRVFAAHPGGEWNAPPGSARMSADGALEVRCGDISIIIDEMQAQGGRRMKARDYVRGHPLPEGVLLGERA